MAEPRNPREPRIPKETAPFDADNKWTRTWIMYFESLFTLSVKEAVRQAATKQGDPGVSTSVFHYRADTTSTSASDPGAGRIRWNNSTQSSATFLYFDWLTTDGFDVTALFELMDAPNQFIIQDRDLALNHQVWQMTGPVVMMPDWFQVPVAFVSSSGAGVFTNNQQISVLLVVSSGGGGGGSGTVTSVALTVPAEFSVSGSPVTTSGTLAVSKATQTANTVYAGPTTGSAAAPTFRAIVPADLPLASSGALVLLEQHTANNTSVNMDFTAFISGSYDEYVLEFLNVVPATNNIIISIRMSVGGTFDTGSNYSAVGSFLFSGSTGVGTAEDTATQIKLWDGVSNSASYGFCGSYRLFSPGSSSLYKVLIGQGFAFSGSAAKIFGSHAWGVYRSASAVDGIRVFSSSGNLTSGTVRVYGIAK